MRHPYGAGGSSRGGGAKGGRGPCLNSVEMLDVSQPESEWRTIAQIPGAARGWCGAAAAKDRIYVVGGTHFFAPKPDNGDDRMRLSEMLEFDPVKTVWKKKRSLPYETGGLDCCVYKDRYIIVAGGWANPEQYGDELMTIYQTDDSREERLFLRALF